MQRGSLIAPRGGEGQRGIGKCHLGGNEGSRNGGAPRKPVVLAGTRDRVALSCWKGAGTRSVVGGSLVGSVGNPEVEREWLVCNTAGWKGAGPLSSQYRDCFFYLWVALLIPGVPLSMLEIRTGRARCRGSSGGGTETSSGKCRLGINIPCWSSKAGASGGYRRRSKRLCLAVGTVSILGRSSLSCGVVVLLKMSALSNVRNCSTQ